MAQTYIGSTTGAFFRALRNFSEQLLIGLSTFRSSSSQMFFKIGVLENFAIFTGKHLRWTISLVKLQASRPATLLNRDPTTDVFL